MVDMANDETRKRDRRRVILVSAVILILASSLPAAVIVWYSMDEGDDYGYPPSAALTKTVLPNGYRVSIVSVSRHVPWDAVEMAVDDGVDSVDWHPKAADLNTQVAVEHPLGVKTIGSIQVSCNATDLAGNGIVNGGDFFDLTTGTYNEFPEEGNWTAKLVWRSSGETVCFTNLTAAPQGTLSVLNAFSHSTDDGQTHKVATARPLGARKAL